MSDAGSDAGVHDSSALRDRFRGTLVGLAVGDALGAPAEFLTAEQIRERWGLLDTMVGGGCHDVAPGETTDATDMALALAESLAERGDFDPEDVIGRYVDWFRTRPRDVSLTVRTALLAVAGGTPWPRAARRAHEVLGFPTSGNGSIMRCAPLALRYWSDAGRRRETTLQESSLTHFDHLAGWSCVAFNDLVAAALAGELHARLPGLAAALDDEDARVAETLREAPASEPQEIHVAAFVLDSLRASLWAVLRSTDFEDALVTIVNLGGDCDTVGAMTGALAGALYGEAAIPARWRDALTVRGRVAGAADMLADRAGI
jgi:ADP-ribosyl-[dinitrogen reductase] hydrolase